MEQNIFFTLCIFCVFHSVMAFNIDPITWRDFPDPSNSPKFAFGYKIIQSESCLIVSDPLIQITPNERGRIYSCPVTQDSQSCSPLTIDVPAEAVNMSLGLTMTKDPSSSNLAICGPTIPKKCKSVTTYNGMCFIWEDIMSIKPNIKQTVPSSLRDCPGQIDIAFLLDGSGSVGVGNFETMKRFVANMIKRFIERDAQFAIAQYSKDCEIHYNFNGLKTQGSMWERNVLDINYQNGGSTYTATAIKRVVTDLFTETAGARPSAKKILVVITDGQSHDRRDLPVASSQAQKKNITRIAIGVGSAFNNDYAKQELNTIATDPYTGVFKVTDFDALNEILKSLEDNIIAIEGTQTSGDSSRMEFAQDGFSTAFTSYPSVLLSAVGAYQWKGGYEEYYSNTGFQVGSEHESYLGYSMAIATVLGTNYAILGAPRHQHKGQVVVSNLKHIQDKLDSPKPQIGSYFGAEVCVVNLNSNKKTDLLLVSAPTYTEGDREGNVFVYFYSRRPLFTYSDTVLVGMAGQRGRFGASLASPADLNGDGVSDVVIGAPLEDDGQGSIYIFNGKPGGIISTYSQRISGSSGRKLFGISLSQSSVDHSKDNLVDIAVGSMGAVQLFRSRPIMNLETEVTYNPSKIPTSDTTDCTKPLTNTLTLCLTMSGYRQITDLSATITYTITLDAKRLKYRAFFSSKNRTLVDEQTIKCNVKSCKDYSFLIERCSEDALNPLSNQLIFTFEGLPSTSAATKGLRPVLQPETKNTIDYNLDFEIDCGKDNTCTDDLRMDFNFTGSTNIEVGIMQEINVTVSVENKGENSYNTDFLLKYPYGLSYRKITSKQGRVECASLDGEQGVTQGETICHISQPIFKGNAQAVFEITYSINKESTFGHNVRFSARVKSGNDQHSPSSILSQEKTISVKYAIFIGLIRHENSSIYINFTAGQNDLRKPIKHILKVENDMRELNFTVSIMVPIKLGDSDIWTDLQILGCKKSQTERKPTINKQEMIEVIKKQRMLNCSVAVCAEFTCDVNLIRNEKILYNISSNVSSGWIEQTGLKAAIFQLVSTASLKYDESKYVFFSTESRGSTPTAQIITQVEVYEVANLTKEIIGGVIGGLLLLALITVALYKAGFFKSQYKQMLEEAQGDAGGEGAN
ncbi:integrin alpha-X isoform X2 [Paramisgurnus dabryanus]|uniref:integrin alpha-X isoform X2 n=2 Tax=Paramisgurnus dabryanus TaxID=90735 RepID=UPI0031F414A2